MKITAKRLRQIITEEVIKEELNPEHAVQAISAMLRGMNPEVTSDVFGDTFNNLYGEEALEAERQRQAAQAQQPQDQQFPTEYQQGGAQGDRPIVGIKENLNEIIQEEYYIYLLQEEWKYSQWGRNPDGSERTREEWARSVLADPNADPADRMDAEELEREGFPPHRDEFEGPQAPAKPGRILNDSPDDIAYIALAWEDFINNTSRENIPQAIATLKAKSERSGKYQGQSIVPILKSLYDRLRNYEQHDVGQRPAGGGFGRGRHPTPEEIKAAQMNEKKLTPAEYKKKKEIADAIKRDNPDMPDDKRYAIATDAAKKSAE